MAALPNKRLLLSGQAVWPRSLALRLAIREDKVVRQQNRETLDGLVSSRGGFLRSVLD